MGETAPLYTIPRKLGENKVYDVCAEEPEDHPALQISVERQDSVHWVSADKKFRVSKLTFQERTEEADDNCEVPDQPFYRKFPEDNRDYAYQINSGPARPEAIDLIYKATFEFEDGTIVDPHIQIGR